MKITTCTVCSNHLQSRLHLRIVLVRRSSQSRRWVFGRKAPGCNRDKEWHETGSGRLKAAGVCLLRIWPEVSGVEQVQFGVMLDQSPLGVDTAHKRVVLQHFLKTWRKYVHKWMHEHEVVPEEVALNELWRWVVACKVQLLENLVVCEREKRVCQWCFSWKTTFSLPVCVFSVISALSSLTLFSFMTRLFGMAAAVSPSSFSSCCCSFLGRFLAHSDQTHCCHTSSIHYSLCNTCILQTTHAGSEWTHC